MSDYIPSVPGAVLAPQGSTAPPAGMTKVNVKTAYGTRVVYVPANMSPDDAYNSVRERVMPMIHAAEAEKAKASAVANAEDSYLGKAGPLAVAVGHGTNDLLEGVKQRLGGGGAAQDASIAAQEAAYAPLRAAMPNTTAAGDFLGKTLPVAAASMMFTPAAAFATPGAAITTAAAQGAVAGALPYIPPGGSLAANMTEGALQGGAAQGPFSFLQKLAMGPKNMLSPTQQSAVNDMMDIPGVSPLPSQLTGNKSLQGMERVLSYFPFAAGQIEGRTAGNRAAVNRAGIKALSADTVAADAGTPDVLAAIKKGATDVYNEVRASKTPIELQPQHIATLSEIRDQALSGAKPDTALAGIIDQLIGKPGGIDGNTMIGGRPFSSFPPEQQAAIAQQVGAKIGTAPRHPDGMPPDYFQSVKTALSDLSLSGERKDLAGKANAVVKDAAVDSLGELGQRSKEADQQYHALKTAAGAFEPSTGDLDTRRLTTALSTDSAGDVAHFGESNNPRLTSLADLANAARGMPPPPAMGSTTASNLTMQKLLGLLPQAIGGGAAALGLHEATGGGAAPASLAAGALGAMAPFLAANYGTKMYLSPAFAKYSREGMPKLEDILGELMPYINAEAAGVGANQ